MSGDDERAGPDRRTFLGASALGLAGLAGLGAGGAGAQSGDEWQSHDHSGEHGGATRLGADDPVASITVADLRARDYPVADVRAYGAAGDGETDDADAIQAALDAADDGDAVFFPPGTYLSSRTLTQSGKSLSLVGAGLGVSEVRFTGKEGGFDLDVPRPTKEDGSPDGQPPGTATVRDLSLVTTRQGGGTALDVSWPYFPSVTYPHATVRNVEMRGHVRSVTGWTTGLRLDQSWHSVVDSVSFVGAGRGTSEAGFRLEGRTIGSYLRNVNCWFSTDGVLLNGRTEGFRLLGGDFVATRYGLRTGPKNEGTPQLVVTDTHCNVSRSAIDLEGIHEAAISGCDLWTFQWDDEDETDPVVRLYGNTRSRLTSNVLVAADEGLAVDGSAQVYVGGNAVRVENPGTAIGISNSEMVQVTGNQVRGRSDGIEAITVTGCNLATVVGNAVKATERGVYFGAATKNSTAGLNAWQVFANVERGEAVVDEGTGNVVANNVSQAPFAADATTTTTEPTTERTTQENETTGSGPTTTGESSGSGGVPGFGAGVAAVGVAGAAMAAARRASEE